MGEIVQRAVIRHQAIRASIEARYRFLFPPAIDRAAIILGRDERGAPLCLPLRPRLEHSHVIGTTGGGKTKLLEHMIRQDIIDGRGVCVFDPHGNHPDSLYRSLLSWLDWRGLTRTRTIHIIDPNNTTHVTGFDPLALPDAGYDPTVIAEALLEAIERLWGEENSDTKPTLQRVLVALVTALCDLGLTLAEARFLFDPDDRYGIRAWAIKHLEDQEASEELQWLDSIATEPRGAAQFRLEVTGPRNRLSKLTRLIALRTMVGQQDRAIDFRAALDDGHVILVNLSGGPRVSDKSAQVLGRILTRMIFFHAQRRLHPERPFFFYLDECQLYLSGDVSRLLSECRKYGLGCVLSHQYLAQFESSGLELLEAVKNTTNCKIALRIKDLTEATDLADMVLPYDLEMPVRALVKPTVVGHRIRLMKGANASEQISNSMTRTDTMGRSATVGRARTVGTAQSTTRSESQSVSEGVSTTEGSSFTEGTSESEGTNASEGVNATRGTSQSSTAGQGRSIGWSAQGSVGGGGRGFRHWADTTETPTLTDMSYSEGADTNSSRADGSSESQGTSASRGTKLCAWAKFGPYQQPGRDPVDLPIQNDRHLPGRHCKHCGDRKCLRGGKLVTGDRDG